MTLDTLRNALPLGVISLALALPVYVAADDQKKPAPPPAGLELRATPSQPTLCVGASVQLQVNYWNMPKSFIKREKRKVINIREPLPRTPKIVEVEYVPIQQVPGSKGKVTQVSKGDVTGGVHYVQGIANFSVKVALGRNVWKFTYGAFGHGRTKGATVVVHTVTGIDCGKKIHYQKSPDQDPRQASLPVDGQPQGAQDLPAYASQSSAVSYGTSTDTSTETPSSGLSALSVTQAFSPRTGEEDPDHTIISDSVYNDTGAASYALPNKTPVTTLIVSGETNTRAQRARDILITAISQMTSVHRPVNPSGAFTDINSGPSNRADNVKRISDRLAVMTAQPEPVAELESAPLVQTGPTAVVAAPSPTIAVAKPKVRKSDGDKRVTVASSTAATETKPEPKPAQKPQPTKKPVVVEKPATKFNGLSLGLNVQRKPAPRLTTSSQLELEVVKE